MALQDLVSLAVPNLARSAVQCLASPLRLEKTHRVDIIDFVDAAQIDDRFFETPYYLVPAKSGEHAYALLREAMREANRIGIAKFILRDTLHLAAVEVIDDAIVLTLMRFADELVDAGSFALPVIKDIRKSEVQMAKTLVEGTKTTKGTRDYLGRKKFFVTFVSS